MQRRALYAVCVLFLLTMLASSVFAGSLKILPTRVFLHSSQADQQSNELKIINEGTETVNLQIKLFAWKQDTSGKDILTPTTDIHFPRIISIGSAKGESVKLVRLTCRVPVSDLEKSYRLLLEEMPVRKPGTSGAIMTIRVSLPLFLQPTEPNPAMTIEQVERSGDALVVTIRNPGNSYIKVGKITVVGYDAAETETFSTEVAGWYVLAGMTKTFEMLLPAEKLAATHTLKAFAQTETTTAASLTAEASLKIRESQDTAQK